VANHSRVGEKKEELTRTLEERGKRGGGGGGGGRGGGLPDVTATMIRCHCYCIRHGHEQGRRCGYGRREAMGHGHRLLQRERRGGSSGWVGVGVSGQRPEIQSIFN